MIDKLLYLGPKGSYSDLAKERFNKYFSHDCEFIALDSISKIIRQLKDLNTESIAAVVPIENSIEGIVRDTQDNLQSLSEKNIRIFAETMFLIEHALIGFGNISDIEYITSHPQALAQCREYLYNNWQDSITLQPVMSTSCGVKSLESSKPYIAAIGSEYSAKTYGIPVIESRINDEKNNTTRFVLLSKYKPLKEKNNKVSVVFSTENKPGALNKVLNIFEKYEINMSYIDSRPSRRKLGEYIFYVDFAGHIEDSNIVLALTEIQDYVKMFSVLSQGAVCL